MTKLSQKKPNPRFGFRDRQHRHEYVETMEHIIWVIAKSCSCQVEFPMEPSNFQRDDMCVIGNLVKGSQRLEVRGRGHFWAIQGCGRVEGITSFLTGEKEEEVREIVRMAFMIEAETPTYEPQVLTAPEIPVKKHWDRFIPEEKQDQPNI